MPLPTTDQAWPPSNLAHIFRRQEVWRAWWAGDPDDLERIYGYNHEQMRPSYQAASYQRRGGAISRLQRWFWGQPSARGEEKAKLHITVAADIATMSADLLFAQPPKLTTENESSKAHDQLEGYIDNGLWVACREAAEAGAALGGSYLRVVWDRTVSDRPWVASVDADCAVPEFSFDRLKAVTFWIEVSRTGDEVVRFLERHEKGSIQLGLYQGTTTYLGRRIPLSEAPDTAGLADEIDQDGDTIDLGPDAPLTAVYVPNMRPNRHWRQPIGRSDYMGLEPEMDGLDETWTSWMRDIRLAKSRLSVPQHMLTNHGPGQGATFATEQELLLPLVVPPDSPAATLQLFQPAIRFQEHSETAQALVEQIVRGSGYSMSTFSPVTDAHGSITATEIAQREKRSNTTRSKKVGYWSPELAKITEALMYVDWKRFDSGVAPEKPQVEFPDAVSPDISETAMTIQTLATANAMSAEVKVKMLHPDWDIDQVEEEVSRLTGTDLENMAGGMTMIAELATALASAVALGGLDEQTAEEMINLVLAQAVDENGDPIPPTSTSIAEAAATAQQAARDAAVAAAAAAPDGAVPSGRPGGPGGAAAGSGGGGGNRPVPVPSVAAPKPPVAGPVKRPAPRVPPRPAPRG